MAINYDHDIGYLKPGGRNSQPSSGNIPEGYYSKSKGQVHLATYDGELRLPFMYRSFISFSFGGLNILDFGIIRVTEGERMQSNLYTEFDDLTLEYDVLHGQFYWGTHFKPLKLLYLLSTDGMTQTQMDKFKAWFAPGQTRLLIRALHPNRGILARVLAPPVMNMLAFLGRLKKTISGTIYNIPTTVYKGDIKISFVCDDPFWYSILNLIGKRRIINYNNGNLEFGNLSDAAYNKLDSDKFYQYVWEDVNGELGLLMNSGDALKIILLDNIPAANMIKIYTNLFLGGNRWIKDRLYQEALGEIIKARTVAALASPLGGENPPYAEVHVSRVGVTYAPAIGTFSFFPDEGQNGTGVTLGVANNDGSMKVAYLYYAGNAPSYPTLYFTITPQLASTGIPYIIYPANKYAAEAFPNTIKKTYNTITIESTKKHEFRFTTPSAWNGYNQALYWFNKLAEQLASWQLVKTYIRDNVTHHGARAHALKIIENKNLEELLTSSDLIGNNGIYAKMGEFISGPGIFSINSKNGICAGKLSLNNKIEIENVGDMVRSTYLFLLETNYPLEKYGTIEAWKDNDVETHHCVHIIYSDDKITDFGIEYKNMYY